MENRKIIIVKSDCYRILAIVKTVLRSVLIVLLLSPLVSLAQQKITWEKDSKEIMLMDTSKAGTMMRQPRKEIGIPMVTPVSYNHLTLPTKA